MKKHKGEKMLVESVAAAFEKKGKKKKHMMPKMPMMKMGKGMGM